ncbi:hypothetical protein Tco_0686402 [Tanacetum coccineum]
MGILQPFKMVGLQSNKCRGDRVRVLLEKILLVQAQEAGQVLDEEQLAFLADPRVAKIQDTHTTITHNVAFQTDDLDAFDSDCDEAPETKSVAVQNTASTEQQNAVIMSVVDEINNQVAKCNAESIKNKNVNESLTPELEIYKERVKNFED